MGRTTLRPVKTLPSGSAPRLAKRSDPKRWRLARHRLIPRRLKSGNGFFAYSKTSKTSGEPPCKHYPDVTSAWLVAVIVALAGCASGSGVKGYSRAQTRVVQEVQMGRVESVREANIEGTRTPIGAGAGAIVDGVAGGTVGSGRGNVAGTVLGAVLGGLVGAAAEEAVTRQKGVEISIQLDSGRLIAITQAADDAFQVGDLVRTLSGGTTTRVSH